MIRIHLTLADLARVRFAPAPAPLQELNAALVMLMRPDEQTLLFGRWRSRTLRSLPAAALALREIIPGRHAPAFLDSVGGTVQDALEEMRATDPRLVRAELALAFAANGPGMGTGPGPRMRAGEGGGLVPGGGHPVPGWVRDLHRGDRGAWQPLLHARRAAFDAVLAPVWPLVQDLHRAEFAGYAASVARHGAAVALPALVRGSRLREDEGVWDLDAPGPSREIRPDGRGVLLLPTFHWTGAPLVSELPGRPVTVTYPAGPGLPLSMTTGAADAVHAAGTTRAADTTRAAGTTGTADPTRTTPGAPPAEAALADVLGRSRLRILLELADVAESGLSTGDLARRLELSAATVSVHTAALRAAGLIASTRDGKSVLHRRAALADLLLGPADRGDGADRRIR